MTKAEKQEERRRAGLKRMQLWWEYSKSPEGRELYQLHAERLQEGFKKWYVKNYPVEAAIEGRQISDRLDAIGKALKN